MFVECKVCRVEFHRAQCPVYRGQWNMYVIEAIIGKCPVCLKQIPEYHRDKVDFSKVGTLYACQTCPSFARCTTLNMSNGT